MLMPSILRIFDMLVHKACDAPEDGADNMSDTQDMSKRAVGGGGGFRA